MENQSTHSQAQDSNQSISDTDRKRYEEIGEIYKKKNTGMEKFMKRTANHEKLNRLKIK